MAGESSNAPPFQDRDGNLLVLVLACALALVTLLAYRHSFFVPFLFDDNDVILNNASLRDIWPRGDNENRLGAKRVLGHVSLAINYNLPWKGPFGFHVVNFGIHVLAGLCLFGLVRRTLLLPCLAGRFAAQATWLAFAAALLWLLHPLHTQAVTYIVQRLEAQMSLFFLLALYALVRGYTARLAWPWHLVAAVSVWAGMATKENMVAAPLVMLLYDRTFLGGSWRELFFRRGVVYAISAAAMCWILAAPAKEAAQLVQSPAENAAPPEAGPTGLSMRNLGPKEYLYSQARVIPHYLRLAVWPDRLCFDYRGMFRTSTLAEAWLPGLFVLTLLVGSFVFWLRGHQWAFLGVTPFLVLAPTSSFYPIVDLANEYRMYLALAPLCTLAVLGVYAAGQAGLREPQSRRSLYTGGLLLAAVALFLRTSDRNLDYRNPLRLWKSSLDVNPGSFRLNYLLATEYLKRGASVVEPEQLPLREEAFAEAERYFSAARQGTNLASNLTRVEAAVAFTHFQRGNLAQAREHLNLALAHNERNVLALKDYGTLLYVQGETEQAREQLQKAISIRISTPGALALLARVHFELGNTPAALKTIDLAERQDPQVDEVVLQKAWILATSPDPQVQNFAEALRLSERVYARAGKYAYLACDVQAAALAANGRFQEAEAAATQAVKLAALEKLPLVEALAARKDRYKALQPFVHQGKQAPGETSPAIEPPRTDAELKNSPPAP